MLSVAFGGAVAGPAVLYLAVTGVGLVTGVRLLAGMSWARTAANALAAVLLVATGIHLANGGYTSLIVGVPGLFMQTAVLCCVNVRSARRYLTN
jgi:hypothetical protein